MDKNSSQGNHFRKILRYQGWNYSWGAWYFVTICTHNRFLRFENIIDGEMILNPTGEMTDQYWQNIPEPFVSVKLDEHIVMPNHLHGILVIKGDKFNICRGLIYQTPGRDKSRPYKEIPRNPMQVISVSLGKIIRDFKGRTTHGIRKTYLKNFRWQRNYYDHIIRNEKELHEIRQYIRSNPLKWDLDRNNPKNFQD